jgi:hypothetical protein|tara:strand:- start:275 stop:730 length:456 start_codon:yes stop_codon:yes gene_type:complete
VNYSHLKSSLINALTLAVQEKIASAKSSIASTTESKNSATKSSAGDKHETGRAMMERELALSNSQLYKAELLLHEINTLPLSPADISARGSLVTTNTATYLLSIAHGKIIIEGRTVFAISCASPIAQTLLGSSAGTSLEFQGRKIIVERVD